MRSQDLGAKEPAYFVIMQGGRAIVAVKDLARATDMLYGLRQQFPDQEFTMKIRTGDLREEQYRCAECGGSAVMITADLEEAKRDACYYKVRSRYKVWPSAYASGALVQCRKKGAANWGNKAKKESMATSADVIDEQPNLAGIIADPSRKFDPMTMQLLVGSFLNSHKYHKNLQDKLPELIDRWLKDHARELESMGFSAQDYARIKMIMHEIMDVDAVFEGADLEENLRKWFKEKWVRFGPDGKIRGDCARGSDSEGKPKCLPQSKAHSLGKKGRASAAARKRRQDPNPDRRGAAKNVATKKESVTEVQKPNHLDELKKATINDYLSKSSAAVRGGRKEVPKRVPSWKVAAGKVNPNSELSKYAKIKAGDLQGMAEGADLDAQAMDIATKLTTGKNLEKLRGMVHDSTVYRALDRYFEKHNIPETIYNRVAYIVFQRIKQQDVAEDSDKLDPRPTVLPQRKETILFIDGKEVAVYDNLGDAVRDARRFAIEHPEYSIVLKRDVCTRTNLARIQEGQSLGDLS